MGLYDRDYMKDRNTKKSLSYTSSNNTKLIIVAVISFVLGFIAGKII